MSIPTVEILRTEAEFFALETTWNELCDDCEYPNVFTTWDWQTTWWRHFGRQLGGELLILVLRREEQVVGIVPFCRRTRSLPVFSGRKHLSLVGFGGTTCPEYLGPLVRRGRAEEVADATVGFLRDHPSEWDSIFLEDYALDDPGSALLALKLGATFAELSDPGETRLTIQLTGDYDAYMETLSYNSRRQRRKRFNQAQKRFGARIEYPAAEDLDRVFPILVDLTTQARTRHGESNPFLDATYAAFHRELLAALLPKERAVLALLYLSEKPAAIWYCFLLGKKCYAYQQGFSPEFEGSPSDVCQQFLIRRLTEEHFAEFDYLRGREAYKESVANSERPTRRAFFFRRRGSAYWSRFLLDRAARPCYRRLKRLFGR